MTSECPLYFLTSNFNNFKLLNKRDMLWLAIKNDKHQNSQLQQQNLKWPWRSCHLLSTDSKYRRIPFNFGSYLINRNSFNFKSHWPWHSAASRPAFGHISCCCPAKYWISLPTTSSSKSSTYATINAWTVVKWLWVRARTGANSTKRRRQRGDWWCYDSLLLLLLPPICSYYVAYDVIARRSGERYSLLVIPPFSSCL